MSHLGYGVPVALVEGALLADLGELHVHLLGQHCDGVASQTLTK